jgi:hypothetical protein
MALQVLDDIADWQTRLECISSTLNYVSGFFTPAIIHCTHTVLRCPKSSARIPDALTHHPLAL